MDETIVAIATALGESSIGVVRLSGPHAVAVAGKIFRSSTQKNLEKVPSHTVHYGWIIDPEDRSEIDEVLVTVMRAPKTYTREDVVEISGHGGRVGVRKILEATVRAGARLAAPGEFTQRAFLNGRIDLSQAEAVLQLVRSTHDATQAMGLKQLRGGLSKKIDSLRQKLLTVQAHGEVSIDFPGENHDIQSSGNMLGVLDEVRVELEGLIRSGRQAQGMWEGYTTVICGRPNVGKSSLLNAWLRRDRAIVAPLPGTTRDTIEEVVVVDGIPIRLIDTAGLDESDNSVEVMGMHRAREAVAACDVALWVLDGSQPMTDTDRNVARLLDGKPTLTVLNKSDLPQQISTEEAQSFFPRSPVISVCASRSLGIDNLQQQMVELLQLNPTPETDLPSVALTRHRALLETAHQAVVRAADAVKINSSPELVVVDVREALDQLGLITGETVDDELLETIFSQFCIGK